MKFQSKVFALLVSLFLCSAIAFGAEVHSDYDRNRNLSDLRTFRFAEQAQKTQKESSGADELAVKRLQSALQRNLYVIGMEKMESSPDFTVTFVSGARKQAQVHSTGRPLLGIRTVRVDEAVAGTAAVEFRDGRTGELIWRGSVSGVIDPDKSEEKINDGIKKLMERFAKDREKQRKGGR